MTRGAIARRAAVGFAVIMVHASQSFAGGFALNESSAKLTGMAYAGSAALAEDAATGYYNVAGLTRIGQGSFTASMTGYLLNLDSDVSAASVYGQPVSGATDVDPTHNTAVPSFQAAWRLTDRWVAGFGATVPYGLEIKYPADSAVRYVATKTQLVTYNLNPMIAYRINDQWSVGAGFNAQYLEAKLAQKIFIPIPMEPQVDGSLSATLSDWGWGANFGILFEPTRDARIGINYRSQISHSLSGTAKVANIPGFKNGGISSDLTTPDTVTAGALYTVLPGLEVLGNLTWTHWAVFRQLRATFRDGLPTVVVEENFRDTWFGSLGVNYAVTDRWSVRIGGAFDQSPVTHSNRTVRIPDSNRWFLGLGTGYHVTDSLVVDFGYLHVFFDNNSVNQTLSEPGTPNVRGSYSDGRADLLSLQITYNFDHLLQLYDELAHSH